MASERGSRRRARELALQVLHQVDVQPELDAAVALSRFYGDLSVGEDGAQENEAPSDSEARAYAETIVRGVAGERAGIDQRITSASKNWRLERMSVVDRNVLRICVFELFHTGDVPPKVAINEAIEVAKRFGEKESSAFVNGVLDRVLADGK